MAMMARMMASFSSAHSVIMIPVIMTVKTAMAMIMDRHIDGCYGSGLSRRMVHLGHPDYPGPGTFLTGKTFTTIGATGVVHPPRPSTPIRSSPMGKLCSLEPLAALFSGGGRWQSPWHLANTGLCVHWEVVPSSSSLITHVELVTPLHWPW